MQGGTIGAVVSYNDFIDTERIRNDASTGARTPDGVAKSFCLHNIHLEPTLHHLPKDA